MCVMSRSDRKNAPALGRTHLNCTPTWKLVFESPSEVIEKKGEYCYFYCFINPWGVAAGVFFVGRIIFNVKKSGVFFCWGGYAILGYKCVLF